MSEEEVIPADTLDAILDRMEGWELVEFLNIPIEYVAALFEAEIVDNLDELEELVGIKRNYNDDE